VECKRFVRGVQCMAVTVLLFVFDLEVLQGEV